MTNNEVIHGFILENRRYVEELSIEVFEFKHILSGAKTVYVKADDKNLVFAIGFITPPVDNTGVSHIIEHSLLCGSKKYPLKEPFVNLLKSSLATFLNAFTSNDWTMYPCASQTPKDFDNLVSVYLDAVFNPLSVEDAKAFLQEGWHYEIYEKDAPLSIKGVVYNEMKGATSSVGDILYQATMEQMYKDTSYRFNAGGDPLYIPDLSYEMYKDFYHKHYTPENALTFFYGDLNIEEKLEMLDREYFSKYKKQNINIIIENQKPHISLDNIKEYPLDKNEDENGNNNISLCYAFSNHENKEELIAGSILFSTLLSGNNSPIKKALLDAKLGENIIYSFDDSFVVPHLYLRLKKTSLNSYKKFKEVFEDEVRKIVSKGIDKDLLLATLNHYEFIDKEFDSGRDPKGLLIMLNLMECFVHNEDLLDKLNFATYYKNIREKIDTDYFEKLLDKYILNSNHHVSCLCKPSKTLEEKLEKEHNEKLDKIKRNMTNDELEKIVKQSKELLAYQNSKDSEENLKKMPRISLKDISKDITCSEVKDLKHKDYRLHYQEMNTNKIAYLELYFDLNKVSYEDLPYLYLLERLFVNVSTKKYKALDLSKVIKTYLGEFDFSKTVYGKAKDVAKPYFVVRASALDINIAYMSKLVHEVMYNSKFLSREVKRILSQKVDYLKQDLLENGMNNATLEARKSLSKASNIAYRWSRGEFVYKFMKNLLDNYDHKSLVLKLNSLIEDIFNKDNVDIFIGGDKKIIKETKKSLKYLKLKDNKVDNKLEVKPIEKESGAFIMQSDVSYNVLTSNIEDFGYSYNGKFIVLSQIANLDYLWNNVRVKGGAYGSGLSIDKTGTVAFNSYRDPNVRSTYEVFLDFAKYLRNYKVSKDELESYIVSAIGGFESPMSTPSKFFAWNSNYMLGVDKEKIKQTKKEILSTKVKDIKEFARIFDIVNNDNCKFTFGNSKAILDAKFDNIKRL